MNQVSALRDSIIKIVEEEKSLSEDRKDASWNYCYNMLRYILDLTPESLLNIRLHTAIFTGEDLNHLVFAVSNSDGEQFAEDRRYKFLVRDLDEEFHIGEPPLRDGTRVGCLYNGKLLNHDLLRQQSYIGNFARLGLFRQNTNGRKKVFFQMGAGYGAIEHHIHKTRPGRIVTVLVDLPLMLMFSGIYLAVNNPDLRLYVYDPLNPKPVTQDDLDQYDVILMPNYRMDLLEGIDRIDYALNTLSLQEMLISEVSNYINFIAKRLKHTFMAVYNDWPTEPSLTTMFQENFQTYPNLLVYDRYLRKSESRAMIPNDRKLVICTKDDGAAAEVRSARLRINMPDFRHRILLDGRIYTEEVW